jgi:hypothetical protein
MLQKNHELDKEICIISGSPKQFHIKTYTTNQNQKGEGCAFKDVILDCVQRKKMKKIV